MVQEFKSGLVGAQVLARLSNEIFKQYFKYFVILGLGIYIPVNVIGYLFPTGYDLQTILSSGNIIAASREYFVILILSVAIVPLEVAALTYFAGQKLNGEDATPVGVMDATFGNWLMLVLISTAYIFIFMLGMILLIVPGVILGVFFNYCVNIVVVEKLTITQIFQKSFAIVKGRWGRTLVVIIVVWLADFAVGTILSYMYATVLRFILPQALWAVSDIISYTIANTLCIVFRLAGVLYFFNLYYTAGAPKETEA